MAQGWGALCAINEICRLGVGFSQACPWVSWVWGKSIVTGMRGPGRVAACPAGAGAGECHCSFACRCSSCLILPTTAPPPQTKITEMEAGLHRTQTQEFPREGTRMRTSIELHSGVALGWHLNLTSFILCKTVHRDFHFHGGESGGSGVTQPVSLSLYRRAEVLKPQPDAKF